MRDRYRPFVRTAAVALTYGWDPIEFFKLNELEAMIAKEVLEVAEDMKAERNKHFIKAIQAAVQNGVARAFGG